MTRDPHRPLREAWIIDAVRTPIGRYGGALAGVRPDDLAALVIRAIVDRTRIDPNLIEDKVGGPRLTVSHDEDNAIRAMQKGLKGGFTMDEVRGVIATAKLRSNEMRDQLLKATGRELAAPMARRH